MQEKFKTVKEAAKELGISEQHVLRLLKNREITAIDISLSGLGGPKSIRISVESLCKFRENRTINPDEFFD